MDLNFFLKGVVVGFSIAAPVGPIGVLCIRRTLSQGRWVGLLSGLGAATADALYGVIAGFGFTALSGYLLRQQQWLAWFGGIFLCYLGLKAFLAAPSGPAALPVNSGLMRAYVTTFLLTLTNPATILSFAAIFAGTGLVKTGGNYTAAAVLVAGVFCGSALWWWLLSSGVSLFSAGLTPRRLTWINRLAGILIGAFGLAILLGR